MPTLPQTEKERRLAWNLETLVTAYEQAGHTNHLWDEPAKLALTEFARTRANVLDAGEAWFDIIRTNADEAVQVGCDDPMVKYLYIKFAMNQASDSKEDFAEAFISMATAMSASTYPPIRKYYAAERTMDQIYSAYGTNAPTMPAARQMSADICAALDAVLADKSTPAREAFDAADALLSFLSSDQDNYERAYKRMQKPLSENWPDAATTWLLAGKVEYKRAWFARGGGYADKVKAEGWPLFFEHLGKAESALEKAWQLDTNNDEAAICMIQVDEGRQKPRDDMELWFGRAMAANPDSYAACEAKLHYLYPQWYGSRDAMIAFGRECVAATNWGGNVPLILSDAHREYQMFLEDSDAKANYWKQPDVWPDIKAAFDRFFELNPSATGYYHNYAWYAFHAEQWDKLNELLPKLGPVNYDYFGGKDEYEKIVRLAKEHAGKVN